jgi:molybdopterin-binding protein
MIQEGIVNKNTRQLFGIVPDSAVQVGDSWTRQYLEKGEIGLATSVTYSLEKVVDSIAYISALGIITADISVRNMLQPSANADLHGKMKGNYDVDMASGLVLKSNVETSAEGFMVVMGKSIPIEIKNTSRVEGKIIKEK